MPSRKLPETFEQILAALTAAKSANDNLPIGTKVLSDDVVVRLNASQPEFESKMILKGVALRNQGTATTAVEQLWVIVKMFFSHFIQVFNQGIARGIFPADDRAFYQLPLDNSSVPIVDSDEKMKTWGRRLIVGDPLRVAAGGIDMAMPTIAQFTTVFDNYVAAKVTQLSKKEAYDLSQEALAALRPDVDNLILRIWNEVETYFSEGDIESKRRHARNWGVVYINMPDEISMEGQVTDVSGIALPDATVRLVEPDVSDDTDAYGQYSIPAVAPGTYTVEVSKEGYQTQLIPNIVITAGVVKLLDIQMISLTGNITVNVLAEGQPLEDATVDIEDLGISAQTNAGGQAFLNNVSPGTWNVQVSKIGYLPQSQPITIVAGQTIILSFELDVA